MRRSSLLLVVGLVGGCAEAEKPYIPPPKRPNNELIVDQFERHPPQGTMAMRFRANGSVIVAKDKASLDKAPALAEGTYTLEKDQMTLTFDKGEMCTAEQQGVYKVVLSKLGIRFTKVSDDCEARAKFDGTTFWRIK